MLEKKKPDNWTVYMHISPSRKKYIGITGYSASRRWRRGGSGYKGQPFYNAIKKYGWDNIQHIILKTGLTKEEAETMEVSLISKYKTNNNKHGYNACDGGATNKGYRHDEEFKRLLSSRMCGKGNHMYGVSIKGESSHMYGRHLSDETKRKISESRKKYVGENSPRYGAKLSEETKEKIRKAHIGKSGLKGESNPMYGVRGINNPLSVKVRQYDLRGNLVKTYNCIREAGEDGFSANNITSCCSNKLNCCDGYIWEYDKDRHDDKLFQKKRLKAIKFYGLISVKCYDIGWNYICTFYSRGEFMKKLEYSYKEFNYVLNACKSKSHISLGKRWLLNSVPISETINKSNFYSDGR